MAISASGGFARGNTLLHLSLSNLSKRFDLLKRGMTYLASSRDLDTHDTGNDLRVFQGLEPWACQGRAEADRG